MTLATTRFEILKYLSNKNLQGHSWISTTSNQHTHSKNLNVRVRIISNPLNKHIPFNRPPLFYPLKSVSTSYLITKIQIKRKNCIKVRNNNV